MEPTWHQLSWPIAAVSLGAMATFAVVHTSRHPIQVQVQVQVRHSFRDPLTVRGRIDHRLDSNTPVQVVMRAAAPLPVAVEHGRPLELKVSERAPMQVEVTNQTPVQVEVSDKQPVQVDVNQQGPVKVRLGL
jgi:methionyl-tRNA formyltransferase